MARSKMDPDVIAKERQVLDLRLAGATFDAIAPQVGYTDGSAAHKAYQRALRRTLQPAADEIRDTELARLDRLQRAIWTNALQGDTSAGAQVIRIMDRRARLLGLDYDTRLAEEALNLDRQRVILLAGAVQTWLLRMGLQDDPLAREATREMLLSLAAAEDKALPVLDGEVVEDGEDPDE